MPILLPKGCKNTALLFLFRLLSSFASRICQFYRCTQREREGERKKRQTDRQTARDVAREGGREGRSQRKKAERGSERWRWRDGDSQHIHRHRHRRRHTETHTDIKQTHKQEPRRCISRDPPSWHWLSLQLLAFFCSDHP
jgi:hypothetical protein